MKFFMRKGKYSRWERERVYGFTITRWAAVFSFGYSDLVIELPKWFRRDATHERIS